MTGTRRTGSRTLGIVVKTSPGALPVLVAAGFVSASACGDASEIQTAKFIDGDASSTAGAGGAGGRATGGANSGGVGTGGIVFGGMQGSGGDVGTGGRLPPGCDEHIVSLPPSGTPTEPGQICAVTVDPVDSNGAARVTFVESDGGTVLTGFVTFDPAVEPRVIGTPSVEVIDATDSALKNAQFGPLTKVSGGYSFSVAFPGVFSWNPGYTRLTVRTTFEVSCGPDGGTSKQVHAATDIHACNMTDTTSTWASSGDRCVVCRVIAEMAPSPIVPDKASDGLPLAKALRLRVIELARVANRVVLFAENDGGDGLDYEWHPSAGEVEHVAPDVIVWTVAPGMAAPLMQVAVVGESEAAVATWSWNEAA